MHQNNMGLGISLLNEGECIGSREEEEREDKPSLFGPETDRFRLFVETPIL